MKRIRMLPPVEPWKQTQSVNGRAYVGAPGQVLDVPEHDAIHLNGNGWTRVEESGPSNTRPAGLAPNHAGVRFMDTTLGLLIVWDGATWRDPATGASA